MILVELVVAALALAPQQGAVAIEIETIDGDTYCSVRAQGAPIDDVMRELASKLGRELTGFERIEEPQRVTVELESRPLAQAVRTMLGAAGLRGRVGWQHIEVASDLPPFPQRAELFAAAELAYVRVLMEHPDSPDCPKARLALGEMKDLEGNRVNAIGHYELLIESYPASELVPEALARLCRDLVAEERWEEVRVRATELANRKESHPYHAQARRDLALSLAHLGDWRQALFVLRALDTAYETSDLLERSERLFVRARALVGAGDSAEALRCLDRIDALGVHAFGQIDSMELRARALDQAGRPLDAALAWLHFAAQADPSQRRTALVRAAELALKGEGDELSVVFLHAQAEALGLGDDLVPYLARARARLGLGLASVQPVVASPTARLREAERLLGRGLPAHARDAFQAVFLEQRALPPDQRVQLARGYATALETLSATGAAIDVLREVVATLEDPRDRAGLYVLAAEIHERDGRFDAAIDAYGGRL